MLITTGCCPTNERADVGAAFSHPGVQLSPVSLARPTQELFENPHFIRYDASCFTINDRDTFILSAAFHYPRCPQALWRERLSLNAESEWSDPECYALDREMACSYLKSY
jgi:hypothetical protein